MFIRCWGSRGSIPVSGRKYLKYGGDTTCLELRSRDGEIMIIDAGSGIRRLGNQLVDERCFDLTMLFTHTHWDHILGFPFFKPVFFEQTRLAIQGCSFLDEDLRERLKLVMHSPYFPVDFGVLPSKIKFEEACETTFEVCGFEVTPIPLSHPNKGQGYRIREGDSTMVFLTDNELTLRHDGGLSSDEYAEFCRGADLLIHDAEFTREEYEQRTKGWGHSYWESVLELAINAGVAKLVLFHHNQDRGDEDLDAIVSECRKIVMDRGLELECFAAPQNGVYVL